MRNHAILAVLVLIAACNRVPSLHVPQAEQAAQAAHGSGERYRAHQRCLGVAKTLEELVACMETEGYAFIARRAEYPSPQCWDARDGEAVATDAPPQCFEHAPGARH